MHKDNYHYRLFDKKAYSAHVVVFLGFLYFFLKILKNAAGEDIF